MKTTPGEASGSIWSTHSRRPSDQKRRKGQSGFSGKGSKWSPGWLSFSHHKAYGDRASRGMHRHKMCQHLEHPKRATGHQHHDSGARFKQSCWEGGSQSGDEIQRGGLFLDQDGVNLDYGCWMRNIQNEKLWDVANFFWWRFRLGMNPVTYFRMIPESLFSAWMSSPISKCFPATGGADCFCPGCWGVGLCPQVQLSWIIFKYGWWTEDYDMHSACVLTLEVTSPPTALTDTRIDDDPGNFCGGI